MILGQTEAGRRPVFWLSLLKIQESLFTVKTFPEANRSPTALGVAVIIVLPPRFKRHRQSKRKP